IPRVFRSLARGRRLPSTAALTALAAPITAKARPRKPALIDLRKVDIVSLVSFHHLQLIYDAPQHFSQETDFHPSYAKRRGRHASLRPTCTSLNHFVFVF